MRSASVILAFLTSVAFVPGWLSPATALRWAILSVGLPVIAWRLRVRPTPAHLWLGMTLAWACLSMAWATSLPDAMNGLWQLCLFALSFVVGAETKDLKPIAIGLALGIACSVAVGAAQFLGLSLDQAQVPRGAFFTPASSLFYNPNFFGEACAVVFALTFPSVPSMFSFVGMLMSGSRGGLLAGAVIFSLYAWKRSRRVTIAIALIAAALTAYAVSHETTPFASSQERVAIWLDTVDGLTLRGHGIGQFVIDYPQKATRIASYDRRVEFAHNEPLHMAFELGIGAIAFWMVFIYALGGPLEPERLALIAILVESMLEFPLHLPLTLFMAGILAGRLSHARYTLRRLELYCRDHCLVS